jgi:hypothetical protein
VTKKNLDLSRGAYDVRVDIGPTYSSQREEAFQTLLEAVSVMPQLAEVAPDLIMKNLSTSEAQEIVRRLRRPLVIQGVVEPNEEEAEELAQIPQEGPDPVEQALVASEMSKAELNMAKADQARADTAETLAQIDLKMAQLKTDLISSITDQIASITGNTNDRLPD